MFSLGARHDMDGNTCLTFERYIMTSRFRFSSARTAQNPWKFSSCSVEYFSDFINDLIRQVFETKQGLSYNDDQKIASSDNCVTCFDVFGRTAKLLRIKNRLPGILPACQCPYGDLTVINPLAHRKPTTNKQRNRNAQSVAILSLIISCP